jgi:hypothetical protein
VWCNSTLWPLFDSSFSLNYVTAPSASSPSSAGHLSSSEAVAHFTATSPLPSSMVRNPYENVVVMAPGTVVHPQSPRTRIRTIAPSAKYVYCWCTISSSGHLYTGCGYNVFEMFLFVCVHACVRVQEREGGGFLYLYCVCGKPLGFVQHIFCHSLGKLVVYM